MSKPEDIDEHLAVLGQKLIDSLEKFTADGKRHPWESPVFKARYMNPISGTKYTLENAAQLAMLGEDQGFKTPYYLTAKQGFESGMSMQKGTEASYITQHFIISKPLTKKNSQGHEEILLDNDGNPKMYKRAGSKQVPVFNLDQFTGVMPAKIERIISAQNKISTSEQVETVYQSLIDTMPTPLTRNIEPDGQHNYYSPSKDSINAAPSNLFKSRLHEFHTIAHEISHSYGHTSRKNRESLHKYGQGNEYRGFEELVANLSAQRIAEHFGLELSKTNDDLNSVFKQNHASYDLGWANAGFKDNPLRIWEAIKMADQTSSTVIQLMTEDLKAKLERNPALEVPDILKASIQAKKESEQAYEQKQAEKTTKTRKYKR
ncbi:TPA: zincin-like metallopeptidase domain-containing protein [Pseudomonas aeruginosa]